MAAKLFSHNADIGIAEYHDKGCNSDLLYHCSFRWRYFRYRRRSNTSKGCMLVNISQILQSAAAIQITESDRTTSQVILLRLSIIQPIMSGPMLQTVQVQLMETILNLRHWLLVRQHLQQLLLSLITSSYRTLRRNI